MARPHLAAFQWLLSILLLALLSSKLVGVSALQFQYTANGSREQFSLLEPEDPSYNGTSPAYGADGAVWLTPDPKTAQELANYKEQQNVGRFIFSQPVLFGQGDNSSVASFSTSFEFQIVTPDAYGKCGDGLAFFIAPQAAIPGNSTGESLGLVNGSTSAQVGRHLFAIEFDTHQNSEMEDPSASHIGIDINSLISIITNNTDSSQSPLYLYNNNTFLAWVEYNASNHQIQVWMSNDTTSKQRPLLPCLESQVDLSIIFNEYMYVGFSASTGSFYEGHALYAWNFSTQGSLAATSSSSPAPSTSSPAISTNHCKHCTRKLLLPLLLSFSALAILAALCIVFLLHRNYRARLAAHHESQPAIDFSIPRYSYSELKKATKGFSDKLLLGQGAFSRVYKGTLQVEGSIAVVAVKKLNEGLGEEAALPSEVKIISSIRHRNLLQLHGWCYHKGKALLVYQYMPNGSLNQHLYGRKSEVGLPSETRYNILLGVAAALEYLHEGLGDCVLHRDVKAANVLLNEDMQPLLGDFGLARLISHNQIVTMTAAGTPGYLAPEVFFTGKATDRADVYSFGALALEVACGRRVLNYEQPPQEMNLIEWAWLLQQSNKLLDALDPKMQLDATVTSTTNEMQGVRLPLPVVSTPITNEIQDATSTSTTNEMLDEHYRRWTCVLHLGLVCCHPLPEARPTMRQVHQVLKETIILPLPTTRPDFPYSSTNSKNEAAPLLFPWASILSSPSQLPTSTSSSTIVLGRSLPSSTSALFSQTASKHSFKHVEMQPTFPSRVTYHRLHTKVESSEEDV